MKGIIFNLLESFIVKQLGAEAYEEILDSAELETTDPFVGPGSYPDADLMRLVAQTVERTGLETPDALRAFGRFCLPELARKFPTLLAPYSHPRSFLRSVNTIHAVEVHKLYDNATPPHFVFEEPSARQMVMHYSSKRRLCALIEGLIDGVADHYGMAITRSHRQCMHQGAEACEIELIFAEDEPAAPATGESPT